MLRVLAARFKSSWRGLSGCPPAWGRRQHRGAGASQAHFECEFALRRPTRGKARAGQHLPLLSPPRLRNRCLAPAQTGRRLLVNKTRFFRVGPPPFSLRPCPCHPRSPAFYSPLSTAPSDPIRSAAPNSTPSIGRPPAGALGLASYCGRPVGEWHVDWNRGSGPRQFPSQAFCLNPENTVASHFFLVRRNTRRGSRALPAGGRTAEAWVFCRPQKTPAHFGGGGRKCLTDCQLRGKMRFLGMRVTPPGSPP